MNALASFLIVSILSFGFAPDMQSRLNLSPIQIGAEANRDRALRQPLVGQTESATTPEEVARNFYEGYLHALYQSRNADPLKEHKPDVEKYVTTRLLQKLANARRGGPRKGADADTEYFFGTLDLSSEWEQHINVAKPTMQGATALVRLSFSGTEPESKRMEIQLELKVTLKQEGGVWKIDDVTVWRQ